jgi:hypothetical protein
MKEHYSSVSGDEVRSGLAKVIALAGLSSTRPANAPAEGEPAVGNEVAKAS